MRPALRSNESSTSLLFGEFCLLYVDDSFSLLPRRSLQTKEKLTRSFTQLRLADFWHAVLRRRVQGARPGRRSQQCRRGRARSPRAPPRSPAAHHPSLLYKRSGDRTGSRLTSACPCPPCARPFQPRGSEHELEHGELRRERLLVRGRTALAPPRPEQGPKEEQQTTTGKLACRPVRRWHAADGAGADARTRSLCRTVTALKPPDHPSSCAFSIFRPSQQQQW